MKNSEERFNTRAVVTFSAAHFVHDCYPAFLGIVLPLLIPKLGLSLAAAGLIASAMRWTTSLQPVLGHWADRRDTRWAVILAPAITAVSISLLGVAAGEAMLIALLLVTGLSHALFHPTAAAMVTRAAGKTWGKGMAWFMTAGELGRTVGPLLIAAVIAAVGLERSWIAFVPGVIASLLLYRELRPGVVRAAVPAPARVRDVFRAVPGTVGALSAAIVLRAAPNVAFLVFYPTLAVGAGYTLIIAGLALTLYELGGTAGAYLGGTLSDRWGRRSTMIIGIVAGVPLMVAALMIGPTPMGLAVFCLAGVTLLSASPVEIVTMQELFPDNRSYAVGMAYLMKSVGAIIATLGVGALGDLFGLRSALIGAVLSMVLAIPFLLVLPSGRTPRLTLAGTQRPAPENEPPSSPL